MVADTEPVPLAFLPPTGVTPVVADAELVPCVAFAPIAGSDAVDEMPPTLAPTCVPVAVAPVAAPAEPLPECVSMATPVAVVNDAADVEPVLDAPFVPTVVLPVAELAAPSPDVALDPA